MDQTEKQSGFSLSDVEAIVNEAIAKRDAEHAVELAAVRTSVPGHTVPANSGGPGTDRHQVSWNLAEQEAAQRGEALDHWK